MNNNYIAALMKKTVLGENAYIFNMIYPIVGFYYEKEKIFMDECGNKYFSITDINFLYSETEYAFSSVISYEKLKELAKIEYDIPIYELKGAYLDYYSDIAYYVSINGVDVYYLPINLKEANQLLIQHVKDQKKDPTTIGINGIKPFLTNELTEEKQDINANDKNESYIEFKATDEDGEIDESLVSLISDIIAKKYNLEKLKEMNQEFLAVRDNLTSLIDTIELQIETFEIENGNTNSIKKYLDENKQKEPKIGMKELYSKLKESVIGQDKPLLRLITEIDRLAALEKGKDGILLTGSTGVGKTLTMNLIAKYINRDFHIVDSTQLTIPGYTGKNIEQVLWDLYVKCDKDLERAENAIIYFDEIDKKGSEKKSDIAGQGVLSILLKFMDGSTYKACENSQKITSNNSVEINTGKMLIIAGGAFTDVYNNLNNKVAGFVNPSNEGETIEPTDDDFIEKGMMTGEFMGRHPIVIHMNDLTIDSNIRILLDSTESPLKKQILIFSQVGVKLSYTDGYIYAVAKKGYDTKRGARGLKKIIADTTWCAYAEIGFNPNMYKEVILTEETVQDNAKYDVVKNIEKESSEKVYAYFKNQ